MGARSERVAAELVSGDYFDVVGIRPALGRTLGPDDNRVPGGHPRVVPSYAGIDQLRETGDASFYARAQGATDRAAPGFNGVDMSAAVDLFVPLMMKAQITPTRTDLDAWRSRWVTVMGRLRPGVSREQAAAAMNVVYRQLLQEDFNTIRTPSARLKERFTSKTLLLLLLDS